MTLRDSPFVLRATLAAAAIGAAGAALLGCQAGYLIRSAASQAALLRKRVPLEDALADPKLSDESKAKLKIAHEAKRFGEAELGLKATRNYETFVQLERPYVAYVVHAAPKNELKPYLWSYPLVGEMPYKGFPTPEEAAQEAAEMRAKGLDVYVRGVSAFSTLGWFRDPIFSSMLEYKEHDLVSAILHETTHATIFIRSESSFNERLATFIGNKGAEFFYSRREGESSPSAANIRRENEDERAFSEFISRELNSLEAWYKERLHRKQPSDEAERMARIRAIQERFAANLRPKLSPGSYKGFESAAMNNARLLTYRLYMEDLSDFEKAFAAMGSDMPRFVAFCKSLEKSDDPAAALKAAGAFHADRSN